MLCESPLEAPCQGDTDRGDTVGEGEVPSARPLLMSLKGAPRFSPTPGGS